MTGTRPLGPLVHSFFLDHLVTVKGLRPASIRSYRDTIRLLLCFIAKQKGTKITKLSLRPPESTEDHARELAFPESTCSQK